MDMQAMRPALALQRLAGRLGPWACAAPQRGFAPGVLPAASSRGSRLFSDTAAPRPAAAAAATGDGASGGAALAAEDGSVTVVDTSRIIETELRLEAERSYLAYAMSVIVGRALPDVRDGLKPVHRRILYAMHELGLQHNKPFRKCARVVGEVLGKFHPHGDTAVYDALVRLAQDFSMRLQLVDGHGNFGSLDDDPPAAMRYTECKLQAATSAMLLADLESDTVDFAPNFDASVDEPTVLPSRLPNLLINGSSGIAVGIATKIPPHNMGEVVAGLKALIANPDITPRQLMRHIPAPDFPTGGEIIMSDAVRQAYEEGKGGILVRAKMHIEDGSSGSGGGGGKKKKGGGGGGGGSASKPLVVITELPYQTNKSALVEQMAKLVDAGTLTGVSDIRDESDRDGVRVVVEVKRGGSPELVMNQMLKHTSVQGRFSCNMVALVGSQPRTLTLKDFLQHFLEFRCQVIERRGAYELARARQRLHLVDGFLTAMRDLDAVVAAIRAAPDSAAAGAALQAAPFGLSKEQSEGVLSLTLRRLTSLEEAKLKDEQATLQAKIGDLSDLLQRRDRILQVVESEADELAAKFGTPRRSTIITDGEVELKHEDIIPNAPSLVVYSKRGYIKRMRADAFALQRRGGMGKAGARLKDDDSLDEVVYVNDHDHLLFFTTEGRAYSVRAYDVPEGSRTSIGTAVTQVLPIPKSARIAAMVPVSDFGAALGSAERDVVMLTRHGQIKRTLLSQFASINRAGLAAMRVNEGDVLQFVGLASPTDSVLLASSNGYANHMRVDLVRRMSRAAAGVKSMRLGKGDEVVAMAILPAGIAPEASMDEEDEEARAAAAAASLGEEDEVAEGGADAAGPCLLIVTEQGLGKRCLISEFRLRSRTCMGVRAALLNPGDRLAAVQVVGAGATAPPRGSDTDTDEQKSAGNDTDVLLSTEQGQLVRVPIHGLRLLARATKGSKLVKVREGDRVLAATVLSNRK
ncbi:DNA gyrase subunit A [Micractinium conductrix]|uniref:DNA topoisomerase (ATP-hydrolyzing) n=1 Tax=Micractinium conductrix TaxID=554055 RepID=A0A2P6VIS1_9CHLO|nr:DNA gyrase subunit A [Micractinium conductrix]|eukprot:PSC74003.1 DNA gyrase subunit A [Micractinium conductrix]